MKIFIKKSSAVLFLLIILCCILPTVKVHAVTLASGNIAVEKPSKKQIADAWLQIDDPMDVFETEPSISAPYKAGALTENYLDSTLSYLNFIRYAANLPEVDWESSLNESAQYASVVLAANDELDHYPVQPSDMDDAFWGKGYNGASSSNLAYMSWGQYVLWNSIQMYMDDDVGSSNLSCVGHRRWLLNPSLLYVGFGQAGHYSATKVFDRSATAPDYDYIAWPSSGNFPNNVFDTSVPWSVCLNSNKYDITSDANVKVTLTRQSDGKQWVFDSLTEGDIYWGQQYLTVNHGGYGDSRDCIIFRPDTSTIGVYEGIYSVEISGISTVGGTETTLQYSVDFFNVDDYIPASKITAQPTDSSCFEGNTVQTTVEVTGAKLKYQWYVCNAGSSTFSKSSNTTDTYSCVMNEKSDGRKAYCVITDYHGKALQTNTVTLSMAKITAQPKTSYTKLGAAASVSVSAAGDGLTYAWYVKDKGATKYTKSSVTSSTYKTTMTDARKDRLLYCVVTDQYGNTEQSQTVAMRMAATITAQPTNASAEIGSIAKTKVTVVGDGLTYAWYIKNPGQTSYSKSSVTSATYSCKMSESNDGRQVYCIVKDKYGKTAQTNTVTFGLPVKITTQPKTAYAKSGATASTTVKADGDGLTYTWYVRNASASKYIKSSITSNTYSIKMSSTSKDRRVYCIVKDKYGNSVQTNTVLLRMAATITTQPKNASAAKGSIAKTTVTAVGDGLKYTWYIKNAGGSSFSKSSVTTASYSCKMSAATDGRQAYCVVTDKYGKTAKSNTVTLKMK